MRIFAVIVLVAVAGCSAPRGGPADARSGEASNVEPYRPMSARRAAPAEPPPDAVVVRNGNGFDLVSGGRAIATATDPRTGSGAHMAEEAIAHWKPEPKREVPAAFAVSDPDVVGRWESGGFMDGNSVAIKAGESGTLRVIFSTQGCMGGWTLDRTAVVHGSRIDLDRPVRCYAPTVADALYVVKVGDEVMLAFAKGLDELTKEQSPSPDRLRLVSSFFHRVPPGDEANRYFDFLDEVERVTKDDIAAKPAK
jgi:hypothetical protein